MINYCNEKLQQLFVDLTIGSEQQEYIIEVSRTVLCHLNLIHDSFTRESNGRLWSFLITLLFVK